MKEKRKIKVGIIGGSGYAGEELIKFASQHPFIDLLAVSSRELLNKSISHNYPHITNIPDLYFVSPEDKSFLDCETLFFATPHGFSMDVVKKYLDIGIKVVDLSADFRLKDVKAWQDWYETKHSSPELIEKSVYGLTELFSTEISSSRLIAVPGCYPTASILGSLPIVSESFDVQSIIIDAKSGMSGAGRAKVESSMANEMIEDFKAYGVKGHRHLPEIEQILKDVSKKDFDINFVPHLIPAMRGIYATIYIQLDNLPVSVDLQKLYSDYYKDSLNVSILDSSNVPSIKNVAYTNECHILVSRTNIPNQIMVISAIDNLIKGASGQAMECFNLMEGFETRTGLD